MISALPGHGFVPVNVQSRTVSGPLILFSGLKALKAKGLWKASAAFDRAKCAKAPMFLFALRLKPTKGRRGSWATFADVGALRAWKRDNLPDFQILSS